MANKKIEIIVKDEDGYPTEVGLKLLREWDFWADGIEGFLDFLYSLWWMPDRGFHLQDGSITGLSSLELHTGGWSGNEDVIGSLQQTLFWVIAWQKSERGGHYFFSWNPNHFLTTQPE